MGERCKWHPISLLGLVKVGELLFYVNSIICALIESNNFVTKSCLITFYIKNNILELPLEMMNEFIGTEKDNLNINEKFSNSNNQKRI